LCGAVRGGRVFLSPATAAQAVVHFAIPTPTRIESKQAKLRRIYLLYETSGDAFIWTVEVWHAKTKIWSDLLLWKGKHSGPQLDPAHNLVWAPSIDVDFSLGLSLLMKLEDDQEGQGDVLFVAAGADFDADV
jgi:hypothetical protein